MIYNQTLLLNMHSHKRAAFSDNGNYFACYSLQDNLLIWETLSNAFIDCKFDSNAYTTCTSLHWISLKNKAISPKKAKLTKSHSSESQLLAVGTVKGDVLLFDVSCRNLYLHLVGRHSGAVNDMCYYKETDSFFTCSADKSIAIWDISSGKQKAKWKTGDEPVLSICVIDENNLLSSSTTITWWNISEKSAVKQFSGHPSEIFKLLAVNAGSLNSCYFLSAAVRDVKINAWSLNSNECKAPVASFVLPEQPNDLDISSASSKDKPLLLSAITKDGCFHLFEHVLNGNINQPIHPKVSLKILPNTASSIVSVKLSLDSQSCIVAIGNSKEDMTFKHIKVKEALEENQTKSKTPMNISQDESPLLIEENKPEKNIPINGLKSPSKCSENSQKRLQLDSVVNSYRRKLRSSGISLSSTDHEILDCTATEDSKNFCEGKNHVKAVNMKNPVNCIDLLLEGLQTGNEEIIDKAFHISNGELIRNCVENLSSHSLNLILVELNKRLCQHRSHAPTLSKWLKEISKVHLNHLLQSEETREILQSISAHLSSLKIHETITKMSALKGLLSLTTQISSSDESNSESEDFMDT